MEISNNRTVTIKMTRGQALKLCRLVDNQYAVLRREERYAAADEWLALREKIRAGVDALDKKGE